MKHMAAAQAAYFDTLRKPLIGVHIRAGDKGLEDQMWGARSALGAMYEATKLLMSKVAVRPYRWAVGLAGLIERHF